MRLLLLLLLRRPTTGVLLAAGLLGALVAHPAAAAKPSSSLFQRVTRSLQNVGSVLTGGGGAVDGAAAAAAMEDMGGAVASMLEAQAEARAREGVDTWATDKVLQLASQAFKGDQLGVLRMMGQAEGLKEIWADPEVARNLLTHFKMFRGIKKMAALADKEGPLTSEDVRRFVLCGWGGLLARALTPAPPHSPPLRRTNLQDMPKRPTPTTHPRTTNHQHPNRASPPWGPSRSTSRRPPARWRACWTLGSSPARSTPTRTRRSRRCGRCFRGWRRVMWRPCLRCRRSW